MLPDLSGAMVKFQPVTSKAAAAEKQQDENV